MALRISACWAGPFGAVNEDDLPSWFVADPYKKPGCPSYTGLHSIHIVILSVLSQDNASPKFTVYRRGNVPCLLKIQDRASHYLGRRRKHLLESCSSVVSSNVLPPNTSPDSLPALPPPSPSWREKQDYSITFTALLIWDHDLSEHDKLVTGTFLRPLRPSLPTRKLDRPTCGVKQKALSDERLIPYTQKMLFMACSTGMCIESIVLASTMQISRSALLLEISWKRSTAQPSPLPYPSALASNVWQRPTGDNAYRQNQIWDSCLTPHPCLPPSFSHWGQGDGGWDSRYFESSNSHISWWGSINSVQHHVRSLGAKIWRQVIEFWYYFCPNYGCRNKKADDISGYSQQWTIDQTSHTFRYNAGGCEIRFILRHLSKVREGDCYSTVPWEMIHQVCKSLWCLIDILCYVFQLCLSLKVIWKFLFRLWTCKQKAERWWSVLGPDCAHYMINLPLFQLFIYLIRRKDNIPGDCRSWWVS